MITIRTFSNSVDAGLAKSLLESQGIEAYLHGENAFSVEPILAFGLRLQVPEEQEQEALRILAEAGNSSLPDDFVPPPSDADEAEHPRA